VFISNWLSGDIAKANEWREKIIKLIGENDPSLADSGTPVSKSTADISSVKVEHTSSSGPPHVDARGSGLTPQIVDEETALYDDDDEVSAGEEGNARTRKMQAVLQKDIERYNKRQKDQVGKFSGTEEYVPPRVCCWCRRRRCGLGYH
jgi:hypothetical protein